MLRSPFILGPLAVASAVCLSPLTAQETRVFETPEVSASRVAVDLVVRDTKGRLVRDLRPGEVEVLENGVQQEVLSLRLIDTLSRIPRSARVDPRQDEDEDAAAAGAAQETAVDVSGPAPPEEAHPLYVAFLFDRLSPEARRAAHDAAVEWLKMPAPPDRYAGVFLIDQELATLQPFTDDRDTAIEAVGELLESTPTTYRSKADRERLRGLRRTLLALEGERSPQAVPGALPASSEGLESTAPLAAGGPPDPGLRDRLRLEIQMLQAAEALERDQQGLTTLNAVLALTNGLGQAPGRKAVIFFSEGLYLPPRVASALQAVVAEANRGGVTFYAVDAGGLRTVSAQDESRREMAGIVADLAQMQRSPAGTTASGRPATSVLERNEDVLRSDPASGLGQLARDTGGFLVRDTNAIARGLRVAQEDLGAYYLVEYEPSNRLWDGRFRRIEIEVDRPGVHVQARQGYYAVKTRTPTPVLDFEAPVLAALELAPNAHDFPFAATAVRGPSEEGESPVAVVVDVGGNVPTTDTDEKEGVFQQDFCALVLVRDREGRAIRKVSRRFLHSGPLDTVDQVRRGRVLLLRQTWLPPGRYTVETTVRDAPSGRTSVRRFPFDIPDEAGFPLHLGSLVVIGHAQPLADDAPAEAPAFVEQGLQLYPSTAGTFSVSSGKPLPFFVAARVPHADPAPRGVVEVWHGESLVFQAPVTFARGEGDRATLLGGVPPEDLPPGDIELRVVVDDGRHQATRSARITLEP